MSQTLDKASLGNVGYNGRVRKTPDPNQADSQAQEHTTPF